MPDGNTTETALRFATSARVDIRAAGATAAEMDKIRELAPDPSVFDEEGRRLFVWSAEISNDNIDTYFTRMHDSTLQNFADDAAAGVMFLDSHVSRKLGFGQSFGGTFKKRRGENPSRVTADFYTLTGMNLNGVPTDDFIAGVRSGVLKDVSVGFLPGRFECNICGGDPMDWWFGDCPHVPGVTYNADGTSMDGDKSLSWWDLSSAGAEMHRALRSYSLRATVDQPLLRAKSKKNDEPILCYAWVIDARLGEVSTVFDGATPGAGIQKAHFLAAEGKADERSIRSMEMQLRVNLPRPTKIYTLDTRTGAGVQVRAVTVPPGTSHDDIVSAVRDALGVENDQGDEPVDADTRTDDDQKTDGDKTVEIVDELVAQTEAEQAAAAADGSDDDESTETDDERQEDPDAEQIEPGDDTSESRSAAEGTRMSGNGGTDFTAALRALLLDSKIEAPADADAATMLESVRTALAGLPALRDRAKLGDQYKASLIEETLSAGRAAYGKDFDSERQQKMLERLDDIDDIKSQRDLYARAAGDRFKPGRATTEGDPADAGESRSTDADGESDLDEATRRLGQVIPMRAAAR